MRELKDGCSHYDQMPTQALRSSPVCSELASVNRGEEKSSDNLIYTSFVFLALYITRHCSVRAKNSIWSWHLMRLFVIREAVSLVVTAGGEQTSAADWGWQCAAKRPSDHCSTNSGWCVTTELGLSNSDSELWPGLHSVLTHTSQSGPGRASTLAEHFVLNTTPGSGAASLDGVARADQHTFA